MAVRFKNAYGEMRFQPETRDGFRLFGNTWYDMRIPPRGKLPTQPPEWDPPTLFKSEKRADKRARAFERQQLDKERSTFKEVLR